MRRSAGISSITRANASTASYSALSTSITSQQINDLKSSLEVFRETLLDFTAKHKEDIKRDPALRHRFQQLCVGLGIDPLAAASSSRSASTSGARSKTSALWADLTSSLSDWQYELAVQIVDICVSTRERNGGLIEIEDLLRRLARLRRQPREALGVTEEDVVKAVQGLQPLKSGYDVIRIDPESGEQVKVLPTSLFNSLSSISASRAIKHPGQLYVRSTSSELGTDQALLLAMATDSVPTGRLLERDVSAKIGWTQVRTRAAFDNMVKRDGLAWVDEQAENDMDVEAVGGKATDTFLGKTIWIPSAIKWDET